MDKNITESDYKKAYKALPVAIFCKSLNCEIKRTKAGFEHVFSQKIRSKEDLQGRGKAIKYLAPLIESINIYQWHEREFKAQGIINYWNLQGVVDGVCIHITIRSIGNQDPHLYSWHYKGISPKIK